jgi:hypothetical protein
MTDRNSLTSEQLREMLHYDPDLGWFMWLAPLNVNQKKPGDIAGCLNSRGYHVIGIAGKILRANRAAWCYVTGEWPEHEIDHEDRNLANNRWNNLRPATHKQNMENVQRRSDNKSGYRGVHFDKESRKWRASIRHHRRLINIGRFETPELAWNARVEKARELFTHSEECL